MAELQNQKPKYLTCSLDRFERNEAGDNLAVLVFDDGQQLVVGAEVLPDGVAKGTVLRVCFAADEAETAARRESIKSLQNELFRD